MGGEFDGRLAELASGVLDGSLDRLDALQELGRLVAQAEVFDPDAFGTLAVVSDDLDAIPSLAQRGLWDSSAFEAARVRGEEIASRYAGEIDPALSLLLVRLEAGC
ncbi:MAG: hypothetical protein HGA39_09725 [Coriobacteriia bacterium]|nr:hypothetical protein [Coriobacteriia bacterium]